MTSGKAQPIAVRELDRLYEALEKRDEKLDARLDRMQRQSSQEHKEMAERVAAVERKIDAIEDRGEAQAARSQNRRVLCRELRATVFGGVGALAALVAVLVAAGVL